MFGLVGVSGSRFGLTKRGFKYVYMTRINMANPRHAPNSFAA
jgi:hypothetical protein